MRTGRPRSVTTEQVVDCLDSAVTITEASSRLGITPNAITQRREPEIKAARQRLHERKKRP